MSCQPYTLSIDNRPIVLVLAAAAVFQLTTPAPVQPNLTILPNPIVAVSIPAPVQPIIQIVQQQVVMEVNLATGGIRGLQGPPGPRGSLFLGGYPSFANLPVPDDIDIKAGDFAFVQDTSTIYELE